MEIAYESVTSPVTSAIIDRILHNSYMVPPVDKFMRKHHDLTAALKDGVVAELQKPENTKSLTQTGTLCAPDDHCMMPRCSVTVVPMPSALLITRPYASP